MHYPGYVLAISTVGAGGSLLMPDGGQELGHTGAKLIGSDGGSTEHLRGRVQDYALAALRVFLA